MPGALPIVVGLDGSADSVRALAWAVREGARLGRPVGVLTAWPVHAPVMVHEVPGHYSAARGHAAVVISGGLGRRRQGS